MHACCEQVYEVQKQKDNFHQSWSHFAGSSLVAFLIKMLQKCKRTLARYINISIPNDERDDQTNIFKQERARIDKLPDEILLLIKSFLPLISQASLALTCRTFFIFMGVVLDFREFGLPYMKYVAQVDDWFPANTLRWELLCLLEDARWLACSYCIKLHPANSFSLRARARKFRGRHCIYGRFSGIVEICPCMRMTFGDKLRLVTQLENLREKTHTESSPFRHACQTVLGSETVDIQAQPALREDGSLIFEIQYEVKSDDMPITGRQYMRAACLKYMPIFTCCLRSMRETIFDQLVGPDEHFACFSCGTSPVNFTTVQNADGSYCAFKVTRNLGKSRKWVDSAWTYQRSLHFSWWMTQEGEENKNQGRETSE